MKHLKINNKDLYIVDNLFTRQYHDYLYSYTSNMNNYQIGFADSDVLERSIHKYYTAQFHNEDIAYTHFFEEVYKNKKVKEFLTGKKLIRATVNSSTASQVNFPHTHHKQWSLVYYINPDWKPEWAGETLFYNEDLSEIVYASIYKPNRCIIFHGSIPHSLRCQSNIAPNYRFSLAMFFSEET